MCVCVYVCVCLAQDFVEGRERGGDGFEGTFGGRFVVEDDVGCAVAEPFDVSVCMCVCVCERERESE